MKLRPLSALLLASALAACSSDRPDEGERPPDVVMVIIDTLRADRLGCYGYELDTSPEIDAFAEGATVFLANSTQCNSTKPSITSILTGVYPRTHRDYLPVPLDGTVAESGQLDSLAELLKAEGYGTYAVWSHPIWRTDTDPGPVGRGWDGSSVIEGATEAAERSARANGTHTNERAFRFLDQHLSESPDDPFFLLVHYFDPHTPYDPAPAHRERFVDANLERLGAAHVASTFLEHVDAYDLKVRKKRIEGLSEEELVAGRIGFGQAMYDAEIRTCSEAVGELFDRLDAAGRLDAAAVAILSDHGENLGHVDDAHGEVAFTHERLYDGVTQVPLILKVPGQVQGQRVAAITQSIDLYPTLLEVLGLGPGQQAEGRSLVPLLRDPAAAVHERVYIESSDHVEKALRTADVKYVEPTPDEPPLLFHLDRDPGELENAAPGASAEVLGEYARHLQEFRPAAAVHVRLSPEERPYEVAIELELDGATIREVVGADGAELDGEERSIRWRARIEDRPREAVLLLSGREAGMRVRLEREGAGDLSRKIWLGATPLVRTAAQPLLEPGPKKGREGVDVDVSYDPELHLFALDLERERPSRADVELRFSIASYKTTMKLRKSTGFTELVRESDDTGLGGVLYRLVHEGDGPASARVVVSPRGGDPRFLIRLDGEWPALDRLRVDGRSVRTDRVGFELLLPADPRVTAALMTPPPSEAPAPGAIAVWFAGGTGPIEIDTGALDPELVEELRALGYVR